MRNPTTDKTLELTAQNMHLVLEIQKQEHQILITQMNILFLTNTALLSLITIFRLVTRFSILIFYKYFYLSLIFCH